MARSARDPRIAPQRRQGGAQTGEQRLDAAVRHAEGLVAQG
ncbi:hypothetical protein QA942_38470 [Streptomyces sp. B21-106]